MYYTKPTEQILGVNRCMSIEKFSQFDEATLKSVNQWLIDHPTPVCKNKK